jgi:Polysaccharide lyase 14
MNRWRACALAVVLATVGCGSNSSGGDAGGAGGASAGAGGTSSSGGSSQGSGGTSAGSGGTSAGSGGTSPGTGGTSSTGGASGSAGASGTGGVTGTSPLPEGNIGIASHYPGDVGIASDPDVLFADDFESYKQASDLQTKWTYYYQTQDVALTTTAADVYAGKQAVEFTIPQQTAELSDGLDKDISPEQDIIFLRYYGKIMAPFDVIGSSHNGSGISAHYFGPNNQATPGVPADGTNKYLVNLEMWRGDASTASPGDLNTYVYWPEQRSNYGDHFFPNGDVEPNTSIKDDFGPNFLSRPNLIPSLDAWHCYELMVRANTPGQRDGRIAGWFDGKLVMDFMNLRLRDVASLTMNRIQVSLHIGTNPNGVAKKWVDNVVAATSYIGPLAQ